MVLKYILNLTKVFIYYLVLFAFCRLVFLIYFTSEVLPEGYSIFIKSLIKALPLDFSAASYLTFIPAVFLLAGSFFQGKFFHLLNRAYLLFTSVLCVLLSISEIGVYREVHVKLYFNLLSHLIHIDELFHSASVGLLALILGLSLLISYGCFRIIDRLFSIGQNLSKPKPLNSATLILVFLLANGILFIAARGGLQPIPINESEVYFSSNQCVNDATVNPLWNIVHSYIENEEVLSGDAYKVMDDSEAEKIVRAMFAEPVDTTVHLFTTPRPNICFLILESWSADVVEACGGYEGFTPNFEKLTHEGYLFTHFKPSGHTSDQGIPAILSGYPALPIGSAINQPEHQASMPCLNTELTDVGYTSSFFFGGQLIYGNIKSYIYRNKFTRVIEQKDLPSSLPAGRLGIHDSIMLNLWLDSINQMKPPFFTCLFTLSTHSPFDAGSSNKINWGDQEQPYLNSIAYADAQIGLFFERAKKQPWYNNTIFILVADHSHNTPRNYAAHTPDFYHIPMLVCGGALRDEFRGVHHDRYGSQTDIASTLLHQLNIKSNSYKWGKNLLNPYHQQFAFYTFNEGCGFADSTGTVVWNKKNPRDNVALAKTEEERRKLAQKNQAMLQALMKDFLSR